jgi:RimJ/RimL family protein N-acetyltransferase
MYFKKIVGENVYLSPIDPDDAEQFAEWMNDYETMRYMTIYPKMVSAQSERETLEQLAKEQNYSIVKLDGDELIGNIGLVDINYINRTADVGIFIGKSAERSKGYGGEALKLLVQYAFDILNLQEISLTLHSDNARALACYKKAGFTEYGRRKRAIYMGGEYLDCIFMQILRPEV